MKIDDYKLEFEIKHEIDMSKRFQQPKEKEVGKPGKLTDKEVKRLNGRFIINEEARIAGVWVIHSDNQYSLMKSSQLTQTQVNEFLVLASPTYCVRFIPKQIQEGKDFIIEIERLPKDASEEEIHAFKKNRIDEKLEILLERPGFLHDFVQQITWEKAQYEKEDSDDEGTTTHLYSSREDQLKDYSTKKPKWGFEQD